MKLNFLQKSMDRFKGTSTGNHRFFNEIWGFLSPAIFLACGKYYGEMTSGEWLKSTMVGNAWNGIPCGGGGVLSKQPGHDDIPKIWTPQRCMTPTAMIFIAFLKDKSYNSLFSYWCLAGNEGMIHWLTINNNLIPPAGNFREWSTG